MVWHVKAQIYMTERHTPSSDFDDWNQEVATVRYRVMVGISIRGRIAHPLDRTKQSVPSNQVGGAHCGARGQSGLDRRSRPVECRAVAREPLTILARPATTQAKNARPAESKPWSWGGSQLKQCESLSEKVSPHHGNISRIVILPTCEVTTMVLKEGKARSTPGVPVQ